MARQSSKGVITIDGPAGAGKSTAARALARRLKMRYVDTGAMYRVAALKALSMGMSMEPTPKLLSELRKMKLVFSPDPVKPRVWMDGKDVSDAIRTPEVAQAASALSTAPAVRTFLVAQQRRMGRGGGVVMEGRDIGTVVFPRAPIKFFLDASAEERAHRRWKEMKATGRAPALAAIAAAIRERDTRDRTRATSPLIAAEDAILIDSTGLTAAQTLALLLGWIRRREKEHGAAR